MKIKYILIILTLCLALSMPNVWGQASSPNYKLSAGSAVGGGGGSFSNNYMITGAVPITPCGTSTSASYMVSGGIIATEMATAFTATYGGAPVEVITMTGRTLTVTYEGAQTATGTLYHRQGGQLSYRTATMTQGAGSTLTYNLASSLLTLRGLEYYFIIDFETATISVGTSDAPYAFLVDVTNAQGQRPVAVPAAQYRIIGLPINTDIHGAEDIFADDLGAYNTSQWRLGRYVSSQGATAEYPGVISVLPGRGYWLITRSAKTYGAPGTTMAPNFDHNGSPYHRTSYTLDTGWNQLANPYHFDIAWGEILFQDGATVQNGHPASVLDNAAWLYTGTGYTSGTTIPGWDGFFVHINKAGIRILFPFHEAGVAKLAPEKTEPVNSYDNWAVNLRLEANGMIDGYNFAGVKPDALAERDQYDHLEPPPPPGGPQIGFINVNSNLMCTDFRPPFDEGADWVIEIADCTNGTLTVSDLDNIPAGMQAWLKFGNGAIIKLDDGITFPVQANSARLIIGTEDYLNRKTSNLLPLNFALEQNYPNPFNPVTNIVYSIPAQGQVKLDLFNVLGQNVRTLVDDILPAGKYTITWDSKDNHGSEVASGIYFYRIEYNNLTEQRKMVLLK